MLEKIFKQRLALFAHLVLLKQSLFGLPWTIVGGLLPYLTADLPVVLQTWALLFGAFFSARFAGMLCNRVIDRHIDAQNPRTRMRAVAQGDVRVYSVIMQAILFLFLFFIFMFEINALCFALAPFLAILIVGYSYTKRFTYFCHAILGLVHFFGPVCAWVAVTGTLTPLPLCLGAALALSITANDIVYSMQDMEIDREEGLFSIPARFGKEKALRIAQQLHLLSVLLLSLCAYMLPSYIFFCGALAVGLLFFRGYVRLSHTSFEKAFTLANTFSGIILLVFTIGAVAWRAL